MPYRPPRPPQERRGGYRLIFRFARTYVWPHRWPVFLCILLTSLNTCAVYLQSFYVRTAADSILMVGQEAEVAPGTRAEIAVEH